MSQSHERLTQSANRNTVERQQCGTTTTNNNKGKDAMKRKTKQKPLDASDLLIETRLYGRTYRLG
jgi:hypothetical protein